MEPVLNQQHGPQHAALGDVGNSMDIIHSESQKTGTEKGNQAGSDADFWVHDFSF